MSEVRAVPVPRLFTWLVAAMALAVILQSVTAGLFVDQGGRDSWVTVHGIVADLTWLTALVAAIVAYRRLRHSHRQLFAGSVALFVLTLAQTGIGHLISDKGMDSLLVVHVPLAMLIFAGTLWLSASTSRASRPGPRVDEAYPDGASARHGQLLDR